MLLQVDVVGDHADRLWQQLVRSADLAPTWNFYKYLGIGTAAQVPRYRHRYLGIAKVPRYRHNRYL